MPSVPRVALVGALLLAFSALASAQIGIISTYAGNDSGSFPGNGGPATGAVISNPAGMAVDAQGNLYIAASGSSVIREVSAGGTITTVAGGGTGGDGGLATSAQIANPCDVKLDVSGNLYFSESCVSAGAGPGPPGNVDARVRRVDSATGIITTIAGSGQSSGFAGDGGPATSALLSLPAGLAIDSAGDIFIADSGNNRIRRIDGVTGFISTVAGDGTGAFAGDGGLATAACLNSPMGVAVDSSGNLWIADTANNRIRRVDTITGMISTAAGTGATAFNGDGISALSATLNLPVSVILNSSGNLIFSELSNNRIRTIDNSGLIWTLAGDGTASQTEMGDGGQASLASLSEPFGIAAAASSALYISEMTGDRVRLDALSTSAAATAVNVSSSAASFAYGIPVILTATLSASNGQPWNATGNISFYDGPSLAGSAPAANGSASLTTSSLTIGVHNISAIYAGDSGFGGSYSPVFAVTITLQTPVVTLVATPNPAAANQPVTLTASLSPSSATGTVTFYIGSTSLGSAPLSGGIASLSMGAFAAGTYSLTAQYGGDTGDSATTSGATALTVTPVSPVTLTSSPNPAAAHQPVTFTASVSPASSTGTVQFLDGGASLGRVPLSGGTASLPVWTLASGQHSITASYGGDAHDPPAVSAALVQTVLTSTSVALTSTQNPAYSNTAVSFTATVTPASAAGTVQFLDGATVLGTAPLSGGSAVFTTSALNQGNHSITASYSGDANDVASVSALFSQSMKSSPGLTLGINPSPVLAGQTVTLTANVVAGATGSVTFTDDGATLATVALVSGSATYATSTLSAGAHTLGFSYGGDANYMSQSATSSLTVLNATSVTLTSGANPATTGQSVGFTATVSPSDSTGVVQFYDGSTLLGSATVISGVAVFATSTLAPGTHAIQANYNGDSLHASASASLSESVKSSPGLTMAVSPNPANVGQTVTLTANVSAAASGSVTFTDGGNALATVPIVAGRASYSTTSLAAGPHTPGFAYSGDSNYFAASANASVTVMNLTSVVLTSSLNPALSNTSVSFTALVTPASVIGTLQFVDGATVLGTAPISGGTAVFTTATLSQGSHSITTSYSGDANDTASVSAVLSQSMKSSAGLTLGITPSPVLAGQTVTLTATVVAGATGSVTFTDGGSGLATVAIVSGRAAYSTSALPAGLHTIGFSYSGDASYMSQSVASSLTVLVSTTTALASNANPGTTGQAVSFTATVSPSNATGSVQFYDGASLLGSASVSSGQAVFTTSSFAQGVHAISATYGGDATHTSSSSATLQETVKSSAGLTVAASANPAATGQTITLTATVAASATGNVAFTNGTTTLATVAVASGRASYATSSLAAGSHSIGFTYSGDANFLPASATIAESVLNPISISLQSNPNNSTAGQLVTFTAKVTPSVATGTVQFRDGSTVIGTANVAGGIAVFATAGLAQGSHSITAAYSGDASDAASVSSASNQTVEAPQSPSSLTATAAGTSQINLTWKASNTSGVAYNVYQSNTQNFVPSVSNRIANSLAATSDTVTGLNPSVTYYFLVTSANAEGESTPSNQASATTAATTGCHVVYTVNSQSGNSFSGGYSIQNIGSAAMSSWTLTWTWPGNQSVTSASGASYKQSGTAVTFTNAGNDGTIAPGATLSGMGFAASYTGTNTSPAAFAVNGTTCK